MSHGYIVRHDGEEIGRTDAGTLFLDVGDRYDRKVLEWSVEAYVGDKERSAGSGCATEMCVIDRPARAELEESRGQQVDRDGVWTFRWRNTNNYSSMCGLGVEYSYGVKVTEKETGRVVAAEDHVNATNYTVVFERGGTYVWGVVVRDNVSESDVSEGELNLCIPSEIE